MVMSKEQATKQDICGHAVQYNLVLGGGMFGARAHIHAHAMICLQPFHINLLRKLT